MTEGARDGRGSVSQRLMQGRGDPRLARNQRSRLTSTDLDETQFQIDRDGRLCLRLGSGLKATQSGGIELVLDEAETVAPFRRLEDSTGGTVATGEQVLESVTDSATANNFATIAAALNRLEEALRTNKVLRS